MAADLVQMTKRGFTNKELSDGLAAEGVSIKPWTLNRYLNEYLVAKLSLLKGVTTYRRQTRRSMALCVEGLSK